jgi:uncharacterized protein (DUF1684 family)
MQRFWFFLLWLFCLPCLAAEKTAYQDWVAFREAFALHASGPTGMYAIQDMHELSSGEAIYLLPGKNPADLRWSTTAAKAHLARVEFKDKSAVISGHGIPATDLLQLKDRQLQLPNKLWVRVSFRGEDALKAWLYNPALPAQKKFKGLSFFPYDPKGRLTGAFRRHEAPVAVNYLDSRDHAGVMYAIGTVDVRIDGRQYQLRTFSYNKAWNGNGEPLLLFLKDRTSGKTTYGGGRVVEIAPGKDAAPGTMAIDLNRAYSFLCAHSDYYNCPLMLTSKVNAELRYGEKYPPL